MNRLLAGAVLLSGCQYDYDKLYDHATANADGGLALQSTQLIGSWIGSMPLTEECIQCAEQQCAQANADCAGDAQCVAFTECVGKAPTPAGQAACRRDFATWVNTAPFIKERDGSGPYGQCVFRYNCTAACTGDSELWCLHGYTLPTTSAPTVPLSLYLIDAFDQMTPIADASVRVCSAQNAQECAQLSAVSTGVTNAQGLVQLELPTSFTRAFTGYLEITGAGRYPTLLKFSNTLAQATTQVVSILGEASFKFALASAMLTTDDSRGMLQLRMLGCQGAGVKGVHFELADPMPDERTWYIVNGLPKLDASETAPVGSGGIIDIPAGSVTVRALAPDNSLVATADAPVRPGFMTVVVFAPQASN